MKTRRESRIVPVLITAAAALLAANLFRAVEPSADAQPVRFNPYLGIAAESGSQIIFRLTNSGDVEAYDPRQLIGMAPRWEGWRRLP